VKIHSDAYPINLKRYLTHSTQIFFLIWCSMAEQGCEIIPRICAKTTDGLQCVMLHSSVWLAVLHDHFDESLKVPSNGGPKPNFKIDLNLHAAPSWP
jgi:hypothetical protein